MIIKNRECTLPLIISGAILFVLCFISIGCSKTATGKLGEAERERVRSKYGQSLEWQINSITVNLDDGSHFTLKGSEAQIIGEMMVNSRNDTNITSGDNYKLEFQRSWYGKWKAVRILQKPKQ
jgi:hypothetical protein